MYLMLVNIGINIKQNSTSVITILSSATDIRFKILNVDTLAVMYDSAKDDRYA